jgi:DNA repair protein RecO (recombination protein O)
VSASQSSPAIVLRARPYGESDKIVSFLTRDLGKLTGIAKGAKRSRRRFVNSLDPLARVHVHFRLRPGATLAFLESCELLRPATCFSEPTRFAYASYLTELVDQMTVEEHPVRELYGLLDEGLLELEQAPPTSALLRGFELQLLTRTGYEPQLDRCGSCQRPLDAEGMVFLDTAHGTLCCQSCGRPGGPLLAVTARVLPPLVLLKRSPLADCRPQSLGAVATDAARLTGGLLAVHLPRPLRSVKLIEQLAP